MARLVQAAANGMFVGGGAVSGECLRLGLADEVRHSIVPVLICCEASRGAPDSQELRRVDLATGATGDYLAGVWTEGMGTGYVRVYALVR